MQHSFNSKQSFVFTILANVSAFSQAIFRLTTKEVARDKKSDIYINSVRQWQIQGIWE